MWYIIYDEDQKHEINVQSDWNEDDSTKDSFIKNKPTLKTITIDLSQVVSQDPLSVEFTQDQIDILLNSDNVVVFLDASSISYQLTGYVYINAIVENEVCFALDFPGWLDGVVLSYGRGFIILNTTTNIGTLTRFNFIESNYFTTIPGYDNTKTQTLKNVNGVLKWIDD